MMMKIIVVVMMMMIFFFIGPDDDDYDDDDGDSLCDIDQILIISRTPKEDSALFSQSAK